MTRIAERLPAVVLIALVANLMLSALAYADGCPRCGCQAGHCTAGIPAHLSCASSTPADKQHMKERRAAVTRAIDAGVNTNTTNCNQLLWTIAAAHGYPALRDMELNADNIVEYLMAPERIEQSLEEGWRFIAPLGPDQTLEDARPITVDDAMHFANAGQLVIGILHSGLMNAAREPGEHGGKPYEHGHVFVVAPGGQPGNTPEESWKQCPVANATEGKPAKRTTANWALTKKHREIVVFLALERQ